MKKYLLLLLLFTAGLTNLFAQHISFIGIPLGQTERIFVRSLQQKGFKYASNTYQSKWYDGPFWNYKEARVMLEVENGKVTSVSAYHKNPNLYNRLSDFNNLVNGLSKKYGKRHNLFDYFTKDDFYVTNGYYWKVSGGYVVASYSLNEMTGSIIFDVRYVDNSNSIISLKRGRSRNRAGDL